MPPMGGLVWFVYKETPPTEEAGGVSGKVGGRQGELGDD